MTQTQPPPLLPPRVVRLWPVFRTVGEWQGIDPLLLAALCDVETECGESSFLDTPGPMGRGDNGHGHGLFQIDDRYHAPFLARRNAAGVPLWAIPDANCTYACHDVLWPALRAFHGAWVPTIGAFNAGVKRVRAALAELTTPVQPASVLAATDAVTANHNYVTRVLSRLRDFGGALPEKAFVNLVVQGESA